MEEKQDQSSDTEHKSGTTASGSGSQLVATVSINDSLIPVTLNNGVDAVSPERLGEIHTDRTESDPEKRPVEQDSAQDTLIHQQIRSRETGSVPAPGAANEQGQSPDQVQRLGSCDGEEKRDQTKEEPPLEMTQQEGWWPTIFAVVLKFPLFIVNRKICAKMLS